MEPINPMDHQFFSTIFQLIERLKEELGDDIALSFYSNNFMKIPYIIIRVRMLNKGFVIEHKISALEIQPEHFDAIAFTHHFIWACKEEYKKRVE